MTVYRLKVEDRNLDPLEPWDVHTWSPDAMPIAVLWSVAVGAEVL